MHTSLRILSFCLLLPLASLSIATGCGGPDIPRTKGAITEDILALPVLYRTPSGKDVIAPGNEGEGGQFFVDHDSGELAWRVWECHNPACPGRTGDEPTLFICPNPDYSANADGTINFGVINARDGEPQGVVLPDMSTPSLYCPECAKSRTFESESAEERQEYAGYILPHVLPESAKRKLELEAEIEVRQQHVDERQRQNAAGGD